jgi:predicted secreted protein
MRIGSIIAIYVLFWTMSAFVVMPFHVRTHEEAGAALIPGQSESAPYEFPFKRVIIRITIVATLFFIAYYLNYTYGWVTGADLTIRH